MKQYLKLKLSQKLSPQQIQLMKLIQLPTLDFEQKIQREIEENPALEMGKNSENEKSDDLNDDLNIDDYISDDDTLFTKHHQIITPHLRKKVFLIHLEYPLLNT